MKTYGGVDVQIHVFLASPLVGGEWSVSRPRQSQSHIATESQSVSQSVSLGVEPHLGPMARHTFWQLRSCFVGRPLWLEDGSVFCICCWPLPAQSFLGPSPLGLASIFYCLRFETSLYVASYDSQGHGGGIRSRLHTGRLTPRSLYRRGNSTRYPLDRRLGGPQNQSRRRGKEINLASDLYWWYYHQQRWWDRIFYITKTITKIIAIITIICVYEFSLAGNIIPTSFCL
jgi:hypothetical protein